MAPVMVSSKPGDDAASQRERRMALKEARTQLASSLKLSSFAELAQIKAQMGAKEFHKSYRPVMNPKDGMIRLQKADPDPDTQHHEHGNEEDVEESEEDDSEEDEPNADQPEKVWQVVEKRGNKAKPQQATSKRRVGTIFKTDNEEGKGRAKQRLDPRFDPLCGELRQSQFSRDYKFLAEYQDEEINILKKQIKDTKDVQRRTTMEESLARLVGQRSTRVREELRQEVLREHRQEDLARVREGAKPFFLRGNAIRKRMAEREKAGMSDFQKKRYDAKREKRKSIKEMHRMPSAR